MAAETPEERRRLTEDVLRHEHDIPPGIFLWQAFPLKVWDRGSKPTGPGARPCG